MKNNNYITDSELIVHYQNGDKKALAILVKRWHLKFCKKAFHYTRDADVSKDIAQDCWIVIKDKLHTLKEPSKYKSWFSSIVNRKSLDYIRILQKQKFNQLEFGNRQSVVTQEIDKQNIQAKLYKAILLLPSKQKNVINLFYTQEYSIKEIAEILGISVGTVKSRLFKAREKLKLTLKHTNYEK